MYLTTVTNRRVRLGGLGDSGLQVQPGGIYTFSFQSSSFKPLENTLLARLSGVRGASVRQLEWVGGLVLGLFSDTLQVTFVWTGAPKDAAQLGNEMASALSWGLIGGFVYQGAETVAAPVSTSGTANGGVLSQRSSSEGLVPVISSAAIGAGSGSNISWTWVAGGGAAVLALLALRR